MYTTVVNVFHVCTTSVYTKCIMYKICLYRVKKA